MRELLEMNAAEREHLQRALDGLDGAFPAEAPRGLPPLDSQAEPERPIPKGRLRRLFLAEVARSPEITVTQASLRLAVARSDLSPVVKQVLAEKLVVKNGAGYSLLKSKHGNVAAAPSPSTDPLDSGDRIGIPLGSEAVAQRPPSSPPTLAGIPLSTDEAR